MRARMYEMREFIMHSQGGYHVETAFIAATDLAEACRAWLRETQRSVHRLMFIATNETAIQFGAVLENVGLWQQHAYSESQFAKWQHVNVGRGWLPLSVAIEQLNGSLSD